MFGVDVEICRSEYVKHKLPDQLLPQAAKENGKVYIGIILVRRSDFVRRTRKSINLWSGISEWIYPRRMESWKRKETQCISG